jgi:hypothetical protein
MGMGLFFTIIYVIILVVVGHYNILNFLSLYIGTIIILHLWFYSDEIFEGGFRKNLGTFFSNGPAIINKNGRGILNKAVIKLNKYPVPVLLLAVSLTVGFYLRLNFSLLNIALYKPDSYGHLYLVKTLTSGQIFGIQSTFNYYPRGFHAIISVISSVSHIDNFTIMRFIGGIFGVISIGAVYVLISKLHNRYSGSIAALLYSIALFDASRIFRVESHATPEVMGFLVAPLVILFAYLTLESSKPNIRRSGSYIVMAVMFNILLFFIHPLTSLIILCIIFPMYLLSFLWREKFDTRVSVAMMMILMLFIIPMMIAEHVQFINWGATLPEIISIKKLATPSAFNFMIIALAAMTFVYGYIERKFHLAFISIACLTLSVIYHTGIFMTTVRTVERTYPYYAIMVTWLVAVAGIHFIGKLEKLWYSISLQIKIMSMIVQNKMEQARHFQNQWYTRISKKAGQVGKAKNYTMPTQIAIFIAALFILTYTPAVDYNYDLFEYNKNIQPTLKIEENFPMNSTVIYSATTFMVNFDKALIEPEGQHTELKKLIDEPPANFTPKRPYTFIFVENSSSTFKLLREGWPSLNTTEHLMYKAELWIEEYQNEYNNSLLYYESPELKVYLIFTVPLEQLVEDFGLPVGTGEEEEMEDGPDSGNQTAVSSRMI